MVQFNSNHCGLIETRVTSSQRNEKNSQLPQIPDLSQIISFFSCWRMDEFFTSTPVPPHYQDTLKDLDAFVKVQVEKGRKIAVVTVCLYWKCLIKVWRNNCSFREEYSEISWQLFRRRKRICFCWVAFLSTESYLLDTSSNMDTLLCLCIGDILCNLTLVIFSFERRITSWTISRSILQQEQLKVFILIFYLTSSHFRL